MALTRGNTSIRATGNAPGPLTLSHTIGAGSGRILFVAVTLEDGTNSIATPTYNSVSMTEVTSSQATNAANKVRWYYLLDPTVGTANISITATAGTAGMCCAGINYTGWPTGGVPVVAATTTSSTTNTVSSGTITKAAGDFFLAAVSQGDALLTNTWTNATEFGDSQGNSLTFSVAYYEGTSTSIAISTQSSSSTSRHALSVIKLVESAFSISVDDDTPSPTQEIVITKASSWNGTPTATLTDNNGASVAMPALTNVTSASATLTLGAGDITNYDDSNATWELIRWSQPLTLTVTDSDGYATDTITITPPVDDHFDTLGASGVYVTSPGTTGDDSYVHVVSGDGEGLPILADLAGNTVPTVARFLCFDVSANKWLAQIEHTFDVASVTLDGEYADAFTGTNGTLITAHTPDADIVGDGYAIEKDVSTAAAVSNAVTIQDNRLEINDGNEGAVINVGTTEPDFSFDWYIPSGATGKEIIAQFRRLDDTEHMHLYVRQSGLVRVNERVASVNIGVTGDNETTHTFVDGTTYRFRIAVVETGVDVYIDDVVVLQVDSTRVANSRATKVGLFAVGTGTFPVYFDNVNVYSDYSASARTITPTDQTVTIGQTVTLNVSTAFSGTINAGTLNGVAFTPGSADTDSCTLTIPAMTEFAPGQAHASTKWYENLPLTLTDGTDTATGTIQIVAANEADFGYAISELYDNAPVGVLPLDGVYVELISGAGTASPSTFGFTTTQESVVRFHAFSEISGMWLEYVEQTFAAITTSLTDQEYKPLTPYRNELKWSNGFGNAAWTKTAGSVSYDSSNDSWKLTEDGTSAEHFFSQNKTVISGQAIVVQAQIATGSASRFCSFIFTSSAMFGGVFPMAVFDRVTGAVVYSANCTALVGDTADGFTTVGMTATPTSSGSVSCQFRSQNDTTKTNPTSAYTGDSASFTLWRRAMFADGSALRDYVHTETVPLRSDQVIVRARQPHNLVGYSNDLSNAAWTKTRCSISGSITLNAGASNGWGSSVLYKVVEDTSTDTHLVNNTADAMSGNSSGVVACRFLAQGDGTRNHLTVRVYGDSASNYYTYTINLTDGTNSSSSVTGTAALYSLTTTLVDTVSSRPVYEVIVRGWPSTTSDTSIYQLMFLLHNGTTNTYLGTSNGVYLGKIHVVNEYTLPDYLETTTAEPIFASNVSGVTLNSVVASIAKDALILHTEDQSQTTPWARTNIHAVTAEGVSADGYPAYKVDCAVSANGTHSLGVAGFQKTLTDSSLVTVFADVKADERTWVSVGGRTKANGFPVRYVNLSNGALGTNSGTSAAETSSRGSGWYRIRVVFDVSTGGTTPGMAIWVAEGDNDINFNGNGANDGILVSRCFAVEGNVAMADADAAYVKAGTVMEYVLDKASAIATFPSIDEFDAAGTHVATLWNRDVDLSITDGTETATGTVQVVPPVAANFATLGDGTIANAPPGTVSGDEGYIHVVSGAGTAYPATMSFTPSEDSTVRYMVADTSEGVWLAYLTANYTYLSGRGVVRSPIKSVVYSAQPSTVE